MTDAQWYVLNVRPQHEFAVGAALAERSIEKLVPAYVTRRRWSDRVKTVTLPLFANYVFCRFSPAERGAVVRTPGVRSLLSFAGCPAAVSDAEIAAIQRMVGSGVAVEPWPFLRVGERVRVLEGPLRGLEGLLASAVDKPRVVVTIELLRRSIAVEVDREALEPLTPPIFRACA
jgi:transcription antitermination factor NusG